VKSPILVCLLLTCLLVAPCLAQTPPTPVRGTAQTGTAATPATPAPPPVVIQATVNGSPVSATQVNQAIAGHWATPILRAIIEERLVRQEARRQGIKMLPEQVQALFEAERAKFPSQAAFERDLHARGYTAQAFIETLITEAMLTQLIERLTAVSDDEIKSYYLEHQADFSKPAQAYVFLIATGTIEEAYLVRERLAAGDKFDDVARELSKDSSGAEGGDLGWVTGPELPDQVIADAVQSMEPGVVSSPLRAGDQFHIVMVKERRAAQIVALAAARAQIETTLKATKAVSREDYVAMLARKATIEVNWAPAKSLAQEYRRLSAVEVVVNGKPVEMPQAPVKMPNGTLIVPAKPVLQAAGAILTWQAEARSLFAQTALGKIKMTVDSPNLIVGADKPETRDMRQPVALREGTLFIAPRVPLEALGATVTWDALRNRLVIDMPTETMPSPTAPRTPGGLERQ
jgi:foldase protein PrsA